MKEKSYLDLDQIFPGGYSRLRLFLAFLSMMVVGCSVQTNRPATIEKQIQKNSAESQSKEVLLSEATDFNGSKAIFSASGVKVQVLEGRSDTTLANTSLAISPGTFSSDFAVEMKEGESIANDGTAQELGFSGQADFAGAGTPVLLQADQNVTVANPMTLALPLPQIASLNLSSDTQAFAVIFRIQTSDGKTKSGLIPNSKLQLAKENLKVQIKSFGLYQVVKMSDPVKAKEPIEIDSNQQIRTPDGSAVAPVKSLPVPNSEPDATDEAEAEPPKNEDTADVTAPEEITTEEEKEPVNDVNEPTPPDPPSLTVDGAPTLADITFSNESVYNVSGSCQDGTDTVYFNIQALTFDAICLDGAFSKNLDLSSLPGGSYSLIVEYQNADGVSVSESLDLKRVESLTVLKPYGDSFFTAFLKSDMSTTCSVQANMKIGDCVHAGLIRRIATKQTSCGGVYMRDNLDAFEWHCLEIGGVIHFESKGLKHGKHLGQILNADSFKEMYVELVEGPEVYGSSVSEVWWTAANNPVASLSSDPSSHIELSTANKIWTLTSNISVAAITLTGGSQAIISLSSGAPYSIQSSATPYLNVPGPSTATLYINGGSFYWIEATVNGMGQLTSSDTAVKFQNVDFAKFVHGGAVGSGGVGLSVLDTRFSEFGNLMISSNGGEGIYHNAGGVTVPGTYESYNTFHHIDTLDNFSNGLYLKLSKMNRFHKIRAHNNLTDGIRLFGSDFNIFTQTVSVGNAAGGIHLVYHSPYYSMENVFHSSLTLGNGADGVFLDTNADDNAFISTLSANNGADGITLNGMNNAVIHLGATGNTGHSIDIGNTLLAGGYYYFGGTCNSVASTELSTVAGLCDTPHNNVKYVVDSFGSIDFPVISGTDVSYAAGALAAGGPLEPGLAWTETGAYPFEKGRCSNGETCVERDIYGSGTHIDVFGAFVINDACPIDASGDNVYVGAAPLDEPFLLGALELLGDQVGNDDGLCNSNEACLYNANLGAGQPTGNSYATCNFDDGASGGVTGVTMYKRQ